MKNIYMILCMALLPAIAGAEQEKEPAFSHGGRPETRAVSTQPRTLTFVHRPATNVSSSRPATLVPVLHPTTPGASAGQNGQASSSGGSYNASYKNAKTFAQPTNTAQAAKLGKGESGMGNKDPKAAQKATQAASVTLPNVDGTQPRLEEVLKQANIPSDLMKQLQNKDTSAAKSAKKK